MPLAGTLIPSALTLVLQGQFTADTAAIVLGVRQRFPELRVIVSCWESDRATIPPEILGGPTRILHSADPGSPRIAGFKLDNIRRQLASTRAGLASVETEYAL